MKTREFKFKLRVAKELDDLLGSGYEIRDRSEYFESYNLTLIHHATQRQLGFYYDANLLCFTLTNAAGKVIKCFYG